MSELMEQMKARRYRSFNDLTEFDAEWVNASTRKDFKKFVGKHNVVYLGKVNRYKSDKGKPYLVKYINQKIYNFEYAFAITKYDNELVKLIKKRENPLEDNKKTCDAIFKRLEELNSFTFIWQ